MSQFYLLAGKQYVATLSLNKSYHIMFVVNLFINEHQYYQYDLCSCQDGTSDVVKRMGKRLSKNQRRYCFQSLTKCTCTSLMYGKCVFEKGDGEV